MYVEMSKDPQRVVERPDKIVISGASGMLGAALRTRLLADGRSIFRLVRHAAAGPDELTWNPSASPAIEDLSALEGCSAAIHLSGASIAGHRWTKKYKRQLLSSRVESTKTLSRLLAGLHRPPQTLIVASAVGIYGDRGDELLDESSSAGVGFLADLCRRWEEAADPARDAGIRVTHARFGVVLGQESGALEKMLPIFRLGLGGRLGSGRQWISWVSVEDMISAILFVLANPNISGPVNVVAPHPVKNAEFTRALAHQLGRPAAIPAPAFALRLVLGQMAQDALLSSAAVHPRKLLAAGFQFAHPTVEDALAAALG